MASCASLCQTISECVAARYHFSTSLCFLVSVVTEQRSNKSGESVTDKLDLSVELAYGWATLIHLDFLVAKFGEKRTDPRKESQSNEEWRFVEDDNTDFEEKVKKRIKK